MPLFSNHLFKSTSNRFHALLGFLVVVA